MVRRAIPFLCLLVLVLGFAGPASSQAPGQGPAWFVTLLTDGGFTGRGLGNVRASSDGTWATLDPEGKKALKQGKLSPEQLKALGDAVARAKPAEWKKDYPDKQLADGYEFHLTLRSTAGGKEQSRRVDWTETKEGELPADLQAIVKVIKPLLKAGAGEEK